MRGRTAGNHFPNGHLQGLLEALENECHWDKIGGMSQGSFTERETTRQKMKPMGKVRIDRVAKQSDSRVFCPEKYGKGPRDQHLP
jgi:hypothetical protein